MKRYKLLKDLPTFKAGDEFYVNNYGDLVLDVPHNEDYSSECGVTAYCQRTLEKFPNILEDWFEEIKEEPKTVYDLKLGDIYYSIYGPGIDAVKWNGTQFEQDLLSVGSVFTTKEEAEKELAWRKARQILKRDTKGFKPNWGDNQEEKFGVAFSLSWEKQDKNGLGYLKVFISPFTIGREIYFATHADAEESIKAHAKEWKIYLGVEE